MSSEEKEQNLELLFCGTVTGFLVAPAHYLENQVMIIDSEKMLFGRKFVLWLETV